jgi:hypothetical protein
MRKITVEVPMVNERLQADMATMLEGLQEQLHGIAELQRQRSLLTATAVVCDKRIQVTVNADGMLVQTLFAEDIADLSYDEIATAMTSAVQAATVEVMRRSRELMQPLVERKTRLPKLSDIIEGAPDLGAMIPVAPPPPPGAPGSPEWLAATEPAVNDGTARRSPVADEGW